MSCNIWFCDGLFKDTSSIERALRCYINDDITFSMKVLVAKIKDKREIEKEFKQLRI